MLSTELLSLKCYASLLPLSSQSTKRPLPNGHVQLQTCADKLLANQDQPYTQINLFNHQRQIQEPCYMAMEFFVMIVNTNGYSMLRFQ